MQEHQADPPPDNVDAISEIARKRREAAERESAIPRPPYVTNVEHSEVMYTLDPAAIPLANVNPIDLVSSLQGLFGLSLAQVDISPLLKVVPREQLLNMEEPEVLKRLVRTAGALNFEAGKFPLRNDFVAIRSVDMNYESILVRVAGVTSVAEAVAQDVVELLWKLAGSAKRWDELKPMILMQGYGTATRVNVDFPAEKFVEKRMLDAIQTNLTDGKKLSRRMGSFKPQLPGETELVGAVFFDELALKISRYNQRTGAAVQSVIRISVTAKNDYGSGRLLIISELDYDDHLALLEEIVGSLR